MAVNNSNNDEFILNPPRVVVGPQSASTSSGAIDFNNNKKKMTEYRILQPDNTLHAFQLSTDCTGQDVIDQVRMDC